jgi:hypothetical protein
LILFLAEKIKELKDDRKPLDAKKKEFEKII